MKRYMLPQICTKLHNTTRKSTVGGTASISAPELEYCDARTPPWMTHIYCDTY